MLTYNLLSAKFIKMLYMMRKSYGKLTCIIQCSPYEYSTKGYYLAQAWPSARDSGARVWEDAQFDPAGDESLALWRCRALTDCALHLYRKGSLRTSGSPGLDC